VSQKLNYVITHKIYNKLYFDVNSFYIVNPKATCHITRQARMTYLEADLSL